MNIDLHADLVNAVKDFECTKCGGFGQLHDFWPNGKSDNTWTCPDCEGTGLKDGKAMKLVFEG